MLAFAKSPKEPMVELLCSLEVVESTIEKEDKGSAVLLPRCLMRSVLMMMRR